MSKKMKRYVKILEPIVVMQLDGVTPARTADGQTYEEDHTTFIRNRTTDPAFVSDTPLVPTTVHWSMPMIVSAEAIRAAVRGLKPGEVLELDDDDWQLLKRATELGNYGQGAASCIPFMRSITGASMDHPDKEKDGQG